MFRFNAEQFLTCLPNSPINSTTPWRHLIFLNFFYSKYHSFCFIVFRWRRNWFLKGKKLKRHGDGVGAGLLFTDFTYAYSFATIVMEKRSTEHNWMIFHSHSFPLFPLCQNQKWEKFVHLNFNWHERDEITCAKWHHDLPVCWQMNFW